MEPVTGLSNVTGRIESDSHNVKSPIDELFKPLMLKIFSFLEDRDIAASSCVSADWRIICNDWQLWMPILQKRFHYHPRDIKPSEVDWTISE